MTYLNAATPFLTEKQVPLGTAYFCFRLWKRSMTRGFSLFAAVLLQLTLLVTASVGDKHSDECGLASVYASVSEATASGEDTQPEDFTAAHRTLPFGTLVRVDNQANGHWAVVRITDRGPFIAGRIIDVSQVAARQLRITDLAQVCLKILSALESRPADKD